MRKKSLLFLIACVVCFAITPFSMANTYSNSISGGWSEDTGYYENASTYYDTYSTSVSRAGTPSHTGTRETEVINGTTNWRAHGWTTWTGVYHYTRARMEDRWDDEIILTDSGRIWGTNGTEAISPWFEFVPNDGIDEVARTYYGK